MKTRIWKAHGWKVVLFGCLGAAAMMLAYTQWTRVQVPSPRKNLLSQEAKTNPTPMPAWELEGVDGKILRAGDFAGKVLVINFWATWCPPCLTEVPGFVALQKKYGARGLVVIGVSLDEGGKETVAGFGKRLGVNYPLVMSDEKIREDFGITGQVPIPITFVVNRQGKVVAGHVGFTAEETFENEIVPLL